MNNAVAVPPTSPSGRQNPRGVRRRGGQGSNHPHHHEERQRGHGFRGDRVEHGGRGSGRGDSTHSSFIPDAQLRINNARSLDHAPDGGRMDNHSDGEQRSQGQVGQQAAEEQNKPVEEGEVCFICASAIEHLSIAPCNHQTCHICALRLRALYKKRDCAYCKVRNIAP
jgi:E3 ubiquitin-protein ligase ZNF598